MDSNLGWSSKVSKALWEEATMNVRRVGFGDDWVVWVWDCVSDLFIYGKKKEKAFCKAILIKSIAK